MRFIVRRTLLVLVLLCSLAAGLLPAGAATQLTIDSVDGKAPRNGEVEGPLTGPVTVRGGADIDEAAGRLVDKGDAPLVADAGDSPFVEKDALATLLGTGYGGTAPYSFRWSTADGKILGRDAATAQINTKGLEPGNYTATLRITDAKGATDTDTVIFVVFPEREREILLNVAAENDPPGTLAENSHRDFPFTVPEGLESIQVDLTWTLDTNDYDLEVIGPDGKVKATSGSGGLHTSESAGVSKPMAGEWIVRAVRFLTEGEPELRAKVEGVLPPDNDPRPVVDAGGNDGSSYEFVTGTPQRLDGTVSGGTAPRSVGWDTDGDGVIDRNGADVRANLPPGRHFATLRATDADGLERRETTVILVGSRERIARDAVPLTVIGVADSGINPYHFEFGAESYPDPEVLELTDNFTRHPSEYIQGYPKDAKAIPITRDQGWFPKKDTRLWEGNSFIQSGEMYWIPGTKIVGALDAGGSTGATSGADSHPILDDNGHGTGSSSVSAGNRYGYCPTCLIVNVEALDETVVAGLPWVDFSTNSFGYIGGAPIGPLVGTSEATKEAAERGQTTLFAAGNGIGNAFDVPISTYGSDQTGPDWNITVGALRREDGDEEGSNQGAITGDGIPAHISSWGDGNLPSACRATVVSQCAFGGTSAATPYTTGVFATVLTEIREVLGDSRPGQRKHQVIAKGVKVPGSRYLGDGELTRRELRAAVLKTAQPLTQLSDSDEFVYPVTYNGPEGRVVFEGYGAATPNSADRAVAVLLGTMDMPGRPDEDAFFAEDCQMRDSLPYGGPYDRTGDGEADGCDKSESVDQVFKGEGEPTTDSPRADDYKAARGAVDQPKGDRTAFKYFLHRGRATGVFGDEDGNDPDVDPDDTPGDADLSAGCRDDSNSEFASRNDLEGDTEPCYGSRVTSVVASFRPLGIWASTDRLEHPLPAGSKIKATIYLTTQASTTAVMRARMSATDRVLAQASDGPKPVPGFVNAAGCRVAGERCWTPFEFEFETKRPAVAGEQVTFSVSQSGTPNWAYGYEGEHRSVFKITPAPMPKNGLEFGVTITNPKSGGSVPKGPFTVSGDVAFPDLGPDPKKAGFHPTVEKVQLSVDDPDFNTLYAKVNPTKGRYRVPINGLSKGVHTVYVRAVRDNYPSEVAVLTFNVGAGNPINQVQWQVVEGRNAPPQAGNWATAVGVANYQFGFDADGFGDGPITIHTRTVQNGRVTAREQVTTTVGGVANVGGGGRVPTGGLTGGTGGPAGGPTGGTTGGPTLPATGSSIAGVGLGLLGLGALLAAGRRRR